jgi:hypothetical protein
MTKYKWAQKNKYRRRHGRVITFMIRSKPLKTAWGRWCEMGGNPIPPPLSILWWNNTKQLSAIYREAAVAATGRATYATTFTDISSVGARRGGKHYLLLKQLMLIYIQYEKKKLNPEAQAKSSFFMLLIWMKDKRNDKKEWTKINQAVSIAAFLIQKYFP